MNNDDVDLRNLDHDSITKAKAAYVDDCKCEWGLFRDRNVTLRQSIQINHGILDLAKKGKISMLLRNGNFNFELGTAFQILVIL